MAEVTPHEDHFDGCGCEVMDKDLPPDVRPTDNVFDFFALYELNGPPKQVGVYVKEGPSSLKRVTDAIRHLTEFKDKNDYDWRSVPPVMEFLLVVEWDNGESYHIRLPEVLVVSILAGFADHFTTQAGQQMFFYAEGLSRMIYNQDFGMVVKN